MSHPLRTAGAVLAAGALSAALLAPPANAAPSDPIIQPASRAGTDGSASKAAAAWLQDELTNGLMMGTSGPDYGLTIDTGMALWAVSDRPGVAAISAAFEPKVRDYVGDGVDESYGGALGKAATFARVARKNPTNYGGVNLITELEERTTNGVPGAVDNAGRLVDKSQYGDFANVVGQSYAVRALSLAGSTEADAAVGFLLAQQCTSGYFRLNFAKIDAPVQGCIEGTPGSGADPDATAIAVVNLIESQKKTPEVKAALEKAGAWLAKRQRNSGAVRGVAPTAVINTNSTAVAGHALALLGNREAALKAARWVRLNQPVDKYKCRTALTKELGAVAYRWDVAKAARTTGITADARDEWRRATAQAVPALLWAADAKDKLNVQRNRRQARAGMNVRFRVFGMAPGERGCFQVKGQFKRVRGNTTGTRIVRGLVMPAGNTWRGVVLKTADDRARAWVKVRN